MRVSIVVCLVVCTVAGTASAQTSTGGSIRGYVKDEQEAVLPRVRLNATSPNAPGTHLATSDDGGYYRLLDLPPGTYTITAELDGFAKWVREDVVVRAGLNIGVSIVMKVGSQTETLEVKADTPLLESRSAVQAINISGELQRALPLFGRRTWADSVLLAPGVASTETGSSAPFLQIHGADLGSNALQIDGADVAASTQSATAYVGLSTDAIQDVQVKIGALDASSPLGMGGVLSVTTKSGTNDLRGAAGLLYRQKDWNGKNVTGGTTSAVSLVQPDVSMGGPIVRDRSWFFGSYRWVDASTGVSRTPRQLAALQTFLPDFHPYDLENKGNFYFFKSLLALGPSHQVTGYYQRDVIPSQTGGGDAAVPGETALGGNAVSVRLLSMWGGSLTTQVGLSYNDKGAVVTATNPDQPVRVVYQTTAVSGGRLTGVGRLVGFGASSTAATRVEGKKATISADASYFKRGWSGSHQAQFGVFLQPRLSNNTFSDYVNGGAAQEDLVLVNSQDPSAGTRVFHKQVYDVVHQTASLLTASDSAFYVQDAWSPMSRLTVTLGVRVDFVHKTDQVFNVMTQRSHELGPRVGVNYSLNDDTKHVVRASFARVHEMLAQNWISLGSSTAGFKDLYDTNGGGVFETTLVTPGSTALNPNRIVYPNSLHQPHVDEWNLGYRRQLSGQVAIDVAFVDRQFKDRMVLVDVNGIYENGVFRGYRSESQIEIYNITNNAWNWNAMRDIDLTVTKQSDRLQLIGTYSRQWRNVGGTWQPNDPASFIQPGTFANNRGLGRQNGVALPQEANSLSGSALAENVGPANQWRDHIARVGIAYAAPWKLRLALSYTAESGPWSGPVVIRIAAADPQFGPAMLRLSNGRIVANPLATTFRFSGSTRGDGQFTLPTYSALNFRITRTASIRRSAFEVAVEGFNLTNNDAPMQIAASGNQIGTANFGTGVNTQLPRSGQLSIRWTF